MPGNRTKENNMAATSFKCSLAGEDVNVNAKLISSEDKELRINQPSKELRRCSHVAKGKCPVRASTTENDDVEGWNLIHTKHCEYLKQVRSEWISPK
ncbi:MAG: hypothetical protein MUP22_12625 [Desulfobacterales bacterium]|nr:hypothetical protein [Desulfobacterales bacterium]